MQIVRTVCRTVRTLDNDWRVGAIVVGVAAVLGFCTGIRHASAQPIGIPAYTTATLDSPEVVLVTPAGRFTVRLGLGCEDLIVGQNVELLPGSGGVASIASPGSVYLCNVQVESRLSEDPCRTDDAGACDVRFDYSEVE